MVESAREANKNDGLRGFGFVGSQIELWRIGRNKINTLESISKLYMKVTSFLANPDHNEKKTTSLTWCGKKCV